MSPASSSLLQTDKQTTAGENILRYARINVVDIYSHRSLVI